MTFASFFPEDEERPFVDREELIQEFKNNLETIKEEKKKVLIYHGVAGIGKTSLRKKLSDVVEKYNKSNRTSRVLWAAVDFETEEFKQPQKFLEILRDQFHDKYGIKFYTFDLAHAIYWKKVNPRIPLYKENYSEDSIITHILNIGDDLSDIGGVFNPVNLSINLIKLIKKFPDLYREWELKNRNEIFKLINKEPADIEKRLYLYWAYDLYEYLQKTSNSVVIFIDSYEALWKKDRSLAKLSSGDKLIRDLIQSSLSSCLWVLSGREPPQWEEDIWENSLKRYKILNLPEEDARYLLESCGVMRKDVQKALISGSNGVPYYLDLAIYTYKNISKSRDPNPGDFAKIPKEVFARFIKYLDEDKESAIKVLSVPRFWDRDIFNVLIKEFTSHLPNELLKLHNFSFIDELDNRKWSMHQLMRQSWQEYQEQNEPDERKRVHEFMFNYYMNKLENIDIKNITSENKIALLEAFYHAKEIFEPDNLFTWFEKYSKPFCKAALWQLVTPLWEELLMILKEKVGCEHPDTAATLNNLASVYSNMGNYDKSLLFFKRSLDANEKIFGPKGYRTAKSLNDLALQYKEMGEYQKALPLYHRALKITEELQGSQHHSVATTLDNLASLYVDIGEYQKALPLYNRSLEITAMWYGQQDSRTAATLNNLGALYYHIGEYDRALPLYQRALEIEENLLGSEHPLFARMLNNLAVVYNDMGEYQKALLLYNRSLEITEKVLGKQHPDITTNLHNLGMLYYTMGEYDKALLMYHRTLEIREKVLGAGHPLFALTLSCLAGVYHEMKEYDKALQLNQQALEIIYKVMGSENEQYARILNNLASIYASMGEYRNAYLLYRQALEITAKVLGSEHPLLRLILDNFRRLSSDWK